MRFGVEHMRLTRIVLVTALVGTLVICSGLWFASRPVPSLASDRTVSADSRWYAQLPADPEAATATYLARIPADMRDTGGGYSDARLAAFLLRLANLLAATAFLCIGRFGAQLRDRARRVTANELAVDAIVAAGYFMVLFVLTLPGELYTSFIRPREFGFSEQTFADWLNGAVINWGIFSAFYLLGVIAIYRLIRWRQSQWVLWSVGVYFALRATYSLLSPAVIEPLTNQFRPLAEGPQRQQILALAHTAGIVDAEVVTGDASRQTRLLDAHVSGVGGWTRISIDDNTLHASSDAMLRAVVAHEIGHYVLRHNELLVVADTAVMAIGFIFVAFITRTSFRRWGRNWGVKRLGDIGGLPAFWGAFLLWGFVALPLSNAISRAVEHRADLFSLELAREPNGLAEFMIHDADEARLEPGPLEYSLFYTHPSDAERVRTAMDWRAAHLSQGGQ
jgi:STE24 endopeptidase